MRGVVDWFSERGHAAFAAVVLSLVAAGISGASLFFAILSRRTSNRVERRQLEIEEQREQDRVVDAKKARLIAQLDKERTSSGSWNWYLAITNEGKGEARDLDVRLDDRPVSEHAVALQRWDEIRQLGPASTIRYMLALARDALLPKIVEMTWVDDSGEPGHYRTTLTP